MTNQEQKAYMRQWYLNNPTKRKDYVLKHLYGISLNQKREIYADQNGKCKLCDKSMSFEESYVDHNHVTKQIRGLLHLKCNTLLGMVNDNILHLKLAIKYLQENPQ